MRTLFGIVLRKYMILNNWQRKLWNLLRQKVSLCEGIIFCVSLNVDNHEYFMSQKNMRLEPAIWYFLIKCRIIV